MVLLFQPARHTVAFLKMRQSTHHSPATYLFSIQPASTKRSVLLLKGKGKQQSE